MKRDREAYRAQFTEIFDAHYPRIFRYLDRIGGDPDLASDLAQEAFVRLYRRGSLPEAPEAWLITVAMNLFRNARSTRSRRLGLRARRRVDVQGDPPSPPDRIAEFSCARQRVRAVLARLTEREQSLLLLSAEGYSYRELGRVLELNEGSVGTLLARARCRFRKLYEENDA